MRRACFARSTEPSHRIGGRAPWKRESWSTVSRHGRFAELREEECRLWAHVGASVCGRASAGRRKTCSRGSPLSAGSLFAFVVQFQIAGVGVLPCGMTQSVDVGPEPCTVARLGLSSGQRWLTLVAVCKLARLRSKSGRFRLILAPTRPMLARIWQSSWRVRPHLEDLPNLGRSSVLDGGQSLDVSRSEGKGGSTCVKQRVGFF